MGTGPRRLLRRAPQVDVPRCLSAHGGICLVASAARTGLAVVRPLPAEPVVLCLGDDAVLGAALLLRLLPATEGLCLQVIDFHGPVPRHVDNVKHGSVAELRPRARRLRPVVLLVRAAGLAPWSWRVGEQDAGRGVRAATHRGVPPCPGWRPRSWGGWRCGTPSTSSPRCPRLRRSTSACPCSRRRGRRAETRRWCTGTATRGRAAHPPRDTRTRCPTRSWERCGACRCGRGRRERGPACSKVPPMARRRARAHTATQRACGRRPRGAGG